MTRTPTYAKRANTGGVFGLGLGSSLRGALRQPPATPSASATESYGVGVFDFQGIFAGMTKGLGLAQEGFAPLGRVQSMAGDLARQRRAETERRQSQVDESLSRTRETLRQPARRLGWSGGY